MEIEVNKIYHCETYEDAIAFLKQCDEQGITWGTRRKASEDSRWYDHKTKTCYRVYERSDSIHIILGDIDYYTTSEDFIGYEIKRYSQISDEELAAIDTAWKDLMKIK